MNSDRKNSIWLAFQYITALIFSFITLKLNLVHFGEEKFGVWIILAAFWGIGSALDFGFGTAIVKYIASAKSDGDKNLINRIASTGFFMFITLGVVLLILGNLAAKFVYYSNTNIIKPSELNLFKNVFLILGLSFYAQYIAIFFRSLYEGLSNFVITSKITLLFNTMILLSVIAIFLFDFSLIYLAIAYVISGIVLNLIYITSLKIRNKEISIKFGLFDKKLARKMFSYSISVQTATLFGTLIDPTLKYIIGNYGSMNIVTYYEVARRFSIAIAGLYNTTFKTFLPKASVLKNRSEYSNFIQTEGIRLTSFGIGYAGIIFGGLNIIFIIIIKLWFGFEQSVIIFLIMSLSESINISGYMLYSFFLGIEKALYLAILQSFNLIFVSAMLIIGFMIFKNYLGLMGVFAAAITINIIQIYFLKKQTGIKIRNYLWKCKFTKLGFLHLFLIFAIYIIYNHFLTAYLVSGLLSIISSFLFYKNIKRYVQKAYSMFILYIN